MLQYGLGQNTHKHTCIYILLYSRSHLGNSCLVTEIWLIDSKMVIYIFRSTRMNDNLRKHPDVMHYVAAIMAQYSLWRTSITKPILLSCISRKWINGRMPLFLRNAFLCSGQFLSPRNIYSMKFIRCQRVNPSLRHMHCNAQQTLLSFEIVTHLY